MRTTRPVVKSEEQKALEDLSLWTEKLQHLANVEVEFTERYLSRRAGGALPAHSAALFHRLGARAFRWRATDGSGYSGAWGLTRGEWFRDNPGFTFAKGVQAMVVDSHDDQSMAFFVREGRGGSKSARIVAAAAGEEEDAVPVARTLAEYIQRAVDARFASAWFLQPAWVKKVRAWMDAQPLQTTPSFEVTVEAVEPAEAEALRAQRVDWLARHDRVAIAKAAGCAGSARPEVVARAISQVMSGRATAQRKKLQELLLSRNPEWRRDWLLEPLAPGLVAVRLHAKRLRHAYLLPVPSAAPFQALQLLLDAKGAQALHAAVDVDALRFCEYRRADIAREVCAAGFTRQPARAGGRSVPSELGLTVVLPKALVPKGCRPGTRFESIAPGSGRTRHVLGRRGR